MPLDPLTRRALGGAVGLGDRRAVLLGIDAEASAEALERHPARARRGLHRRLHERVDWHLRSLNRM
jgi:hypothetical protein